MRIQVAIQQDGVGSVLALALQHVGITASILVL